MNTTTLVIVGVIVLAVIIVLALVLGRSRGLRRPKLRELTPEARDRYGSQWDKVEARFVDDPEGAVREADSILMGMLRERDGDQRDGEEDASADHEPRAARRVGSQPDRHLDQVGGECGQRKQEADRRVGEVQVAANERQGGVLQPEDQLVDQLDGEPGEHEPVESRSTSKHWFQRSGCIRARQEDRPLGRSSLLLRD